jgi:phytoene synthase
MLPPETRNAALVTYAFFRQIDDLVDQSKISLEEFRIWRNQALQPVGEQSDPILAAWADIRDRYRIDPKHIQDMLDGLEMDLVKQRYETLEDLFNYSHKAATAGGFLGLEVIRPHQKVEKERLDYLVKKTGIAVQMTDILCDVGEDAEKDRIYLPHAELAAFGLSDEDIKRHTYDERFKRLMRHLAQVTRQAFTEAWPIIRCFSGATSVATAAGLIISRSLLDEADRLDYDVFTHRISFSKFGKLKLLLTKWPSTVWPSMADRFFKT